MGAHRERSYAFAPEDFDRAGLLLSDAVQLFQTSGDPSASAVPMILLGQTLSLRGDFRRGMSALDEGLALASARGDRWEIAKQQNFRGQILLGLDDPDGARVSFEQALGQARAEGDRLLILTSLSNLALSHHTAGAVGDATHLLEQGVMLSREAGDDASASFFIHRLATLTGDRPEGDRAQNGARHARASSESAGTTWLRAFAAPTTLLKRT